MRKELAAWTVLISSMRRISVKSLNDKTNVPLMAGEIVEKCKLIHPSKVNSAVLGRSHQDCSMGGN